MADPSLNQLIDYQDKRALAQQQQAELQKQREEWARASQQAQPAPRSSMLSGIEDFLAMLLNPNPAGQPLAPYDEKTKTVKPRSFADILFGGR